jgi:hypothetical protein
MRLSFILSLSFTLNGLNMTIKRPEIILPKACWEAKPIATAATPAPAINDLAMGRNLSISYNASENPTM